MRSAALSIRHGLLLIGVGAISVFGMVVTAGARELGDTPVLKFGLLFFGWLPVILVHELGHAVVAWMTGWRVALIHVAPFAWRIAPPLFTMRGNMGGPDIGGYVVPIPRSKDVATRARSIAISVGGPLASWLSAGLLFAAVYGLPWPRDVFLRQEDPLRIILFVLAVYSLAAAIGSTVPDPTRGGNDGAHILARAFSDRYEESARAAVWADWYWQSGVPRSQWSLWIMDQLRESAPSLALTYDFLDALWRDDISAARRSMELLKKLPWAGATAAILQSCLLCVDDQGAAAEDALASVNSMSGVSNDVLLLRDFTFAEISRLEGDFEAAAARLQRLRRTIFARPELLPGFWHHFLGASSARLQLAAR